MPRRNVIQCREQWHNHLDPTLKQGQFSEEEDILYASNPNVNKESLLTKLVNKRIQTQLFL